MRSPGPAVRQADPWPKLEPIAFPTARWAVALAWLLALIFAATGLGKALDVVGFALILRDFRIAPDALLMPLALAVVVLEFAIAAGLLVPATRARAAAGAMLVATGNALVLSVTLWRGIPVENCGCFGTFLARPLTLLSPIEDLVLFVLAWLVWREARR